MGKICTLHSQRPECRKKIVLSLHTQRGEFFFSESTARIILFFVFPRRARREENFCFAVWGHAEWRNFLSNLLFKRRAEKILRFCWGMLATALLFLTGSYQAADCCRPLQYYFSQEAIGNKWAVREGCCWGLLTIAVRFLTGSYQEQVGSSGGLLLRSADYRNVYSCRNLSRT